MDKGKFKPALKFMNFSSTVHDVLQLGSGAGDLVHFRHLVDDREVDGDSSLGGYDDAKRCNASTVSSLMEGSEIERTDIIQALVERIDVRRDCVELTLRPVGEKPTQALTAAATLIRSGRQTRLVPPGVFAMLVTVRSSIFWMAISGSTS